MEAGRARGNRDNTLFRLSLGLTSVRHLVERLEAEYTHTHKHTEATTTGLEVVKYDPNVDTYVYDDFTFGSPNALSQVPKKFAVNLALTLSRCVPSVTLANFGVLSVATAAFAPRMISYLVLYPFCRLVFGTLYPAYASYKAVRTKNLKEYVKWMMYWIVFALFTCTETFTDVFLSWFPFYYEVKIVLVLWLLSPATKGSSILYRKFVHPALCRREQEIDEYIAKAKDQGYHTVLNLGTKGVNYATTVIMQTAIKGGGGLVQQLRKSYSLSDLTECEPREERGGDEADDVLAEPRLIRRALKRTLAESDWGGTTALPDILPPSSSVSYAARRSASESNNRQPMYFPEVDVDVRSTRSSRSDEPDFSHIKSTEDISSGYSSADNSACLTRAGSVGAAGRRARTPRTTTVTTIKRPPAAEDNEVLIEEIQDDDSNTFMDMPSLVNISSRLYLSHTNPPFIYQYVGDQVKIIKVLGQLPLDDQLSSKSNIPDEKDQTEISSNINVEKDHCTPNKSTEITNSINELSKISIKTGNSTLDSPNLFLENEKVNVKSAEDSSNKDQIVNEEKTPTNLESDCNVSVLNTGHITNTFDDINNSRSYKNEKELTDENETESVTDNFAEPLSFNYSSDDEASYGTPDDSPNSSRKLLKGKYGKNKAPLPPVVDKAKEKSLKPVEHNNAIETFETTKEEYNTVAQESNSVQNENQSKDTDNFDPVEFKEPHQGQESISIQNENQSNSSPDNLDITKTRQKSKSPLRSKPSASGFGKLLQLPSKLAFWHKTDEKLTPDDHSVSSGEKSRKNSADDLLECVQKKETFGNKSEDIIEVPLRVKSQDKIGIKDEKDVDNECTTQNIIEKSDVLQKLIVAKIESHPEYKYVPFDLENEIQTSSKSTDV